MDPPCVFSIKADRAPADVSTLLPSLSSRPPLLIRRTIISIPRRVLSLQEPESERVPDTALRTPPGRTPTIFERLLPRGAEKG